MIYLDYAANTPVAPEVLELFHTLSTKYIANPNATHPLGKEALALMDTYTEQLATRLGVVPSEIIYTSGATEANNLALQGTLKHYKKYGRHIITTYMEHASITYTVASMQEEGFEVDYVDILPSGQVDLEHLKELLRPDTILVSIHAVDSELGIRQPIEVIKKLTSEYEHCLLHVDATQAIGKIPFSCEEIDLITFAPHKFNGLNGVGVLIKKEPVLLQPMILGGKSHTLYRSGTPMMALAATVDKAVELALPELTTRLEKVQAHNNYLREQLMKYKDIVVNSTQESSPYILNFSFKDIKASDLQQMLGEEKVYVSTKSACSTAKTPSRPVYALTKNRKLALSSMRISLGHETTREELERFITLFEQCYTCLQEKKK